MPSPHSSPRTLCAPSVETLARFAVIMAILIAVAAFPQSAVFSVVDIDVVGAVSLSPDDVTRIAGVQAGERLFAIDAASVARRLRADPRIAAATVAIVPPRTVMLRITERRPVAALVVRERVALIGDDLVVVAMSSDAAGLPLVVERGGTPGVRPGVLVTSEGVRQAILALSLIPPGLRDTLYKIAVAPGPDLTLTLSSGIEVRAGGIAGLAERLAPVQQVLRALQGRGIAVAALDLRYTGFVAVTPLGVGAGAGEGQ